MNAASPLLSTTTNLDQCPRLRLALLVEGSGRSPCFVHDVLIVGPPWALVQNAPLEESSTPSRRTGLPQLVEIGVDDGGACVLTVFSAPWPRDRLGLGALRRELGRKKNVPMESRDNMREELGGVK